MSNVEKKAFYKKPIFYVTLAFILFLVLIIMPSKNNYNQASKGNVVNAQATAKDSASNTNNAENVDNTNAKPSTTTNQKSNNTNASNNQSATTTPVKSANNTASKPTKTTNVNIIKVVNTDYTVLDSVVGVVNSQNTTKVSAESSGVIAVVKVNEGDKVTKNQVVAVLQNKELVNQKQSLLADIDDMVAKIKQQEKNLQRYESLLQEGFASEVEVEQARLDVNTLKQKLVSLQVALKNNAIQQNKLMVRATATGVVKTKKVEEGDFIGTGGVVVELIDTNNLKVTAGVSFDSAKYIKVGSSVNIFSLTNNTKLASGTVTLIKPEIDSTTKTSQVQVNFKNTNGGIKVGGTVKLNLPLQTIKNAVLLPARAVILRPAGYVVYVLSKSRKDLGKNIYEVTEQVVSVEEVENGIYLENSGNLVPNSLIVLEGAGFLTNNALVKVSE